jgi:predicted ATPase/class 3 adenylate cyclase
MPAETKPAGPLRSLMPESLVHKLQGAREQKAMLGERRIVTMLFCDVKGSTAAAGNLDPEEWAEIINGAFERMISPVYQYEGTVARLMGDGILAFFGAPLAHEDDPQRAVLAGLKIVENMQPYRQAIDRRWGVDFDVRVGVNTGLVMVGQVGSDLQMEYTAMGDAINLAARMEQTAAPGTVQVAEDTYRLIAPAFDWQDLGEVQVKGKPQPLRVYRPLSAKTQPGRLRGLESFGISSPLVGREAEIAFLKARLESLSSGRGACVLLIGEAGMGKSRLVAELRAALQDGPGLRPAWIEAATLSYRQGSSYYIIRQIIRRAIGAAESDAAPAVRQKLAETCGCCSLPGGDIPFLEALLAVESEDSLQAIRVFEGEALVRRMTEATRGFICGLAQESPLVLVCDDLHWADLASLDLLLNLADLTRLYPLAILGLTRPDRSAPSWDYRRRLQEKLGADYAELSLAPLSPETSQVMLANLLAFDQLPAAVRSLILKKAEGNPFYVEEVVRVLIDSGAIDRQANPDSGRISWVAARPVQDIDLPENLQTLLIARIDRLEEDSRRTLQLASVIGRSFYYRVLEEINRAIDLVHSQLQQQLSRLQQAELILEAARQPELEFTFRHALTQEAAYSTILHKQRREYHRQAGEVIETLFSDRLEEFYPLLAHHYSEAEDERAAQYAWLAGEAAFRLFAIPEAEGHYSNALRLLAASKDQDGGRLRQAYLRLGRCLELQNRYPDALQHYMAMQARAVETGDGEMQLAAMCAQAIAHAIPGAVQDSRRAAVIADQALELSRALADRQAEAKVHWIFMLIPMYSGHMDRGIPPGEAAVALAQELEDKELLARALQDLALCYMAVGRLGDTRRTHAQALRLAEEQVNYPMVVENHANLVLERILSGDFQAAIEHAQAAFNLATRIQNEWGIGNSQIFTGLAHYARGEFSRTLQIAKQAAPKARQLGHPGAALVLAVAAEVYASLNAWEKAYASVEQAMQVSATFPYFHHYTRAVLARFEMRAGELQAASEWIAQIQAEPRYKTLLFIDTYVELVIIEFHIMCGDLQRAGERLQAIFELLEESGARYFLPEAYGLRARLSLAQGQPEEAVQALDQAQMTAGEIGFQTVRWPLLLELSKRVETGQARLLREQAARIAAGIEAQAPDSEVLDRFRARLQADFGAWPLVEEN